MVNEVARSSGSIVNNGWARPTPGKTLRPTATRFECPGVAYLRQTWDDRTTPRSTARHITAMRPASLTAGRP